MPTRESEDHARERAGRADGLRYGRALPDELHPRLGIGRNPHEWHAVLGLRGGLDDLEGLVPEADEEPVGLRGRRLPLREEDALHARRAEP